MIQQITTGWSGGPALMFVENEHVDGHVDGPGPSSAWEIRWDINHDEVRLAIGEAKYVATEWAKPRWVLYAHRGHQYRVSVVGDDVRVEPVSGRPLRFIDRVVFERMYPVWAGLAKKMQPYLVRLKKLPQD